MAQYGLINYNLGGRSLEEVLDFASEAGFTHIEIGVRDVWNDRASVSLDEGKRRAEQVRAKLDSVGMKVSAVAPGNDFLVKSAEEMEQQIQRLRNVIEICEILGSNVLRADGGWAKEGVPEEKWFDLMVDGFKRLSEITEPIGFKVALDNHGIVTNDADLQLRIFEAVGSPNLGANVDTMNYRWAGHDLDTIGRFYKIIAPHAFHVHLKDGRGSRDQYVGLALGEGEIDLKGAIDALVAAGYKGVWTVEYEGRTDPLEGYRKGLAWVKENVPV